MLRGNQYWNLVSVDVQREDGTQSRVTGAVFGNQPHIVQVTAEICVVAKIALFPYLTPAVCQLFYSR